MRDVVVKNGLYIVNVDGEISGDTIEALTCEIETPSDICLGYLILPLHTERIHSICLKWYNGVPPPYPARLYVTSDRMDIAHKASVIAVSEFKIREKDNFLEKIDNDLVKRVIGLAMDKL